MGNFWKITSLFVILFQHLSANTDRFEVPMKTESVYIPYSDLGKTISSKDDKLGFRLMSESDVKKNMETVYTQFTTTKYDMIDSTEEASDLLELSGSLSLKLHLGLVGGSGQGTGSYFKEMGDRSNYAELLYVAKVINKFDVLKNLEFLITDDQCRKAQTKGVSHVITGITYGGQCIISCRIRTTGNKNKEEVKGEIKASLGLINITLNANGALKLNHQLMNRFENITVKTYCNANLKKAPTNLKDAIAVVTDSLNFLQTQNRGGVPINMELTPLEQIPNCNMKKTAPNPALFEIYMEGLGAMVEDIRGARSLLFKCIEAYPLDKSQLQLREKAEALGTELKDTKLKLTTELLTVSQVGSVEQFKKFDDIYTNQHSGDMWNHRFWAAKVHDLCHSMRENRFTTLKRTLAIKTLTIDQKCIINRNVIDTTKILSSEALPSNPTMEAFTKKCYVSKDKSGNAFFMARIIRPDVFLHDIEATAVANTKTLDFYLTKDLKQFTKQFDIKKFAQVEKDIESKHRLNNSVILIKLRSSAGATNLKICNLRVNGGPCIYD